MSFLYYNDNQLYIEEVSLKEIAELYGTPSYIYSYNNLITQWKAFNNAFSSHPHLICYAVKANSNLNILRIFAELQSGFDIVSIGELERVLKAGGDPKKIVFSGVGKRVDEIKKAIQSGIYCFNVESAAELDRLQLIAEEIQTSINIALRVNPNVDPRTHAHISTGLNENKFGIDLEDVLPLCKTLSSMPALNLIGIACHIGSQITELEPFRLTFDCLVSLYQKLVDQGITLKHIDIGGGLGIQYNNEKPPSLLDYANIVKEKLSHLPLKIIIEPGRALVGNAGVLLTKVEYLKHSAHRNFAIVDAGMNDLIRPALYDAWQEILPVEIRETPKKYYDIAGPVCESADFLGKHRLLSLEGDDLLVVKSAGAYGFSMSSNYNSRCRPIEVMINKKDIKIIRRRETIEELFAAENLTVGSGS